MKKFIIAILILILGLTLVLLKIKKYYYDYPNHTGGYINRTNNKAPKTIASKEITSFNYTFYVNYHGDHPTGREILYRICDFSLKREENGARCIGSGYSEWADASTFEFEFLAPLSALDDLQVIIDKRGIASSNGIDEHVIGIPENLGAMLGVGYASGESIYAYNNAGPVINYDANLDIYDFFIDLAMEEDQNLLDSGDKDWELHRLLKKGVESKDGKRTILFDLSRIFIYKDGELVEENEFYLSGLYDVDDKFSMELFGGNGDFKSYEKFIWTEGRFLGQIAEDEYMEFFIKE